MTSRQGGDPREALIECYDLWASGAWQDDNAVENLREVMQHVAQCSRDTPTCDVCGTTCEELPGDLWCGECGCCWEHCQDFVGCGR